MTPTPPALLLRYIRTGRCVLFCGSGLSAWGRLPTWSRLLEEVVGQLGEDSPDDSNMDELRRLLAAGKLLEVADHCKEVLGRRYNDILSERLRGGDGEIPEPHKVIVQMPFAALVTTNYDKLLERSYANVGSLPKTPTHRDVDALGPLLFDGSFFILKAHGDIDRPESMVMTTRDYQEIIHSNPAFNSIFSALLLTKAVLFVGYSLNDPDFRLLLDRQLTIFRGNVPERYALMSGVGRVERDVLWRTARIKVLPYDDHEQVLDFLRTMLDGIRSAAATAPPPSLSPVPLTATQPASVALRQEAASGIPSTVLSLRLRAQMLEASVSVEGNAVQGEGRSPDWAVITKAMRPALMDEAYARTIGEELASCLPANVVQALEQVPRDHIVTLVLAAEVELLPWEMTVIGGQHLVLRNPLVRAPTGLSDTARGYPVVRHPPRVLLIGDPKQTDGLPLHGAKAEVEAIEASYRRHGGSSTLLIGADATLENVAAALASGDHDIVHFAGPASFDEVGEPYLRLSGDAKLSGSELRSLISPRPPALLILNSQFTVFTPPGVGKTKRDDPQPAPAGQRAFIDAASTAGVGMLVGSYSDQLNDDTAQFVGASLHTLLLQGEPIARALHRSLLLCQSVAGTDPSLLSYGMSGHGLISIPRAAGAP